MVWGGGSASRVRERHAEGAPVVAWGEGDPSALARFGVPARALEEVIGSEGLAAATGAARTWTRLWGRLPLVDGESFRDLVAWRGISLLWLAEGFLRNDTAGPRCAALSETALLLLDATGVDEVDAVGLAGPEATILARACTARGVLFHGPAPKGRALAHPRARRRTPLARLFGAFAPNEPPPLPAPWAGGPTVADSGGVLLIAGTGTDPAPCRPLLEAAAAELGLGARVALAADLGRWETRGVRRRGSEAEAHLRECRGRLRGAPGLHESYAHRGIGFGDLAAQDLDGLLLDHLPRAISKLEAAIEFLSRARPAVAVVAGAARDERRTLLAACEITETPGVAVLDASPGPEDPDRADGGPGTGATVVWDPGGDVEPVLTRLRELTRGRAIVGSE